MLDKSLEFLRLLRDFEEVKRKIYRPDGRQENDVEHSYQIAMMAWFWADQFNLDLSQEKLLKYALVHDLIEVHAGDTPAYSKDKSVFIEKEKKEKEALEIIKKDFAYFPDLISMIESYEDKQDEESVFTYEIDKLVPLLNLYMDDGYGWNKLKLTLEQIKKEKRSKVKTVPQLVDLLEEALGRAEKEQDRLFDLK